MEDLSKARILLVNDDGIGAPGLKYLERIARRLSKDVWVFAPETEQSGASHSFTLTGTIRAQRVNRRRFSVSGSPTDCVLLALSEFLHDHPPDIVLSGINRGANLAEEVTYSGTVAGAMEAALFGIRAIALSQATGPDRKIRWSAAQHHAEAVVRRLLSVEWTRDVFMNVNFPACDADAVCGVSVVKQGRRSAGYEILKVPQLRGRDYYLIGESQRGDELRAGDSDHQVIDRNKISITPLHVDLTHRGSLTTIRALFAKRNSKSRK
jgi:5'-nucleotidase